jgi:hypothetical protein
VAALLEVLDLVVRALPPHRVAGPAPQLLFLRSPSSTSSPRCPAEPVRAQLEASDRPRRRCSPRARARPGRPATHPTPGMHVASLGRATRSRAVADTSPLDVLGTLDPLGAPAGVLGPRVLAWCANAHDDRDQHALQRRDRRVPRAPARTSLAPWRSSRPTNDSSGSGTGGSVRLSVRDVRAGFGRWCSFTRPTVRGSSVTVDLRAGSGRSWSLTSPGSPGRRGRRALLERRVALEGAAQAAVATACWAGCYRHPRR